MSYFELNWLHKKDRAISMPRLVFFAAPDCGGLYYYPDNREKLIGDKYFPLDCGLIVISPNEDGAFMAHSLAHEWRHHWQFFERGLTGGSKWHNNGNYEKAIISYFRRHLHEWDALLYANRMAPCSTSLEWERWIRR